MSIVTQAQARYSAAFLASISNPQDETSGAADAARMAVAELDVKGFFRIHANEDYDETKVEHVAVAIKCWLAVLQVYTGQAGDKGDEMYKQIETDLKAVAKIGSRDRILVTSTSQLQPSQEMIGSSPPLPDSDRSTFQDLVPGPLSSSDDPRYQRR